MIKPGPESHTPASGNPGAVCVCVRGQGGGSVHCRGGCSPLPSLGPPGPSEGTQLPPGTLGLTCRKHGHLLPSRARNPSSRPQPGRSIQTQDRTRLEAHHSRLGASPAGVGVRGWQKAALGRESFALHCPEEATGSRVEALGRSGYTHWCTRLFSLSHTHTDTYTRSPVTTHLHSYTATDTRTQSRCGNSPGFRGIQVL